jgi:hypothetical protein
MLDSVLSGFRFTLERAHDIKLAPHLLSPVPHRYHSPLHFSSVRRTDVKQADTFNVHLPALFAERGAPLAVRHANPAENAAWWG